MQEGKFRGRSGPSQCASAILMVRPRHFGFNVETAGTNRFQQAAAPDRGFSSEISQRALVEFDAFAAALDTWRKAAGEGGPTDKYRFTMQMVDAVIARYADITDGEMNDLTTMLRRFAADQAREAARDYAKAAVAA